MHQTKDDEHHTASYRIALHFVTLLEQQFPVINSQRSIELHYPHQFADQLNVHVNHLNRALKKIFGKTTTHLISERILNESKRLLTEGELTASEIAFTLGFSEPTHFTNFFKKRMQVSPIKYRQAQFCTLSLKLVHPLRTKKGSR